MQDETPDQQPSAQPPSRPGTVVSPGGMNDPLPPPPPAGNSFVPETTEQNEPFEDGDSIRWTASEYIHHPKNASWFLLFSCVIVIVSAGTILLLHSIFSGIIVLVIGIAFGITAARSPRELAYQIGESGIEIGKKFYRYDEFKSFTIDDEDGINSIVLVPLKRFSPPISIYYDPKDGTKIMEVLDDFLPRDDSFTDPFQKMMKKIKF